MAELSKRFRKDSRTGSGKASKKNKRTTHIGNSIEEDPSLIVSLDELLEFYTPLEMSKERIHAQVKKWLEWAYLDKIGKDLFTYAPLKNQKYRVSIKDNILELKLEETFGPGTWKKYKEYQRMGLAVVPYDPLDERWMGEWERVKKHGIDGHGGSGFEDDENGYDGGSEDGGGAKIGRRFKPSRGGYGQDLWGRGHVYDWY